MSEAPRYSGFVPGLHTIDGYGRGGFVFAGMSHRGSILALPSGIHAWAAVSVETIDVESLAALFAAPRGSVELLLLGTGPRMAPAPKVVREALKAAGVGLDVMSTGSAAATYNLLLGEKRRVAAALIAAP